MYAISLAISIQMHACFFCKFLQIHIQYAKLQMYKCVNFPRYSFNLILKKKISMKIKSSLFQAIYSVYFGGFNKDGIYFVARVARRHGRYAEVWLYLHLPGVGDFHHPVHPDTLISNVTPGTLTAGGLKIEMLDPMVRWRVSFNGLLR